jgi:hypothetical protein
MARHRDAAINGPRPSTKPERESPNNQLAVHPSITGRCRDGTDPAADLAAAPQPAFVRGTQQSSRTPHPVRPATTTEGRPRSPRITVYLRAGSPSAPCSDESFSRTPTARSNRWTMPIFAAGRDDLVTGRFESSPRSHCSGASRHRAEEFAEPDGGLLVRSVAAHHCDPAATRVAVMGSSSATSSAISAGERASYGGAASSSVRDSMR